MEPTLALSLALLCLPSASGPTDPPHVVRHAADVAATVAHYRALGFDVAHRDERAAVFRPRGGVVLEVTAAPVDGGDPLAADRALVVPLAPAELTAARRSLARDEIAVDVLVARPSGLESLRVRDPDGHATILRGERDAAARVAVPASGELNPIVVELLARYPSDGTHRYFWPKSGGWKGNTKDLEYGGEVFAPGDPDGRCYCCGLTFEVFVDAWRVWCARNGRPWRIADLDVDGVRALQRQWFGSAADRSCLHTALVANDLGHRIVDWDDAAPGDFVQLWRANGSGHSVVFLSWERDGDGPDAAITGIRYWSTQGSTNGVGERVERFTDDAGKRRVLKDELWLCRAGVRVAAARR